MLAEPVDDDNDNDDSSNNNNNNTNEDDDNDDSSNMLLLFGCVAHNILCLCEPFGLKVSLALQTSGRMQVCRVAVVLACFVFMAWRVPDLSSDDEALLPLPGQMFRHEPRHVTIGLNVDSLRSPSPVRDDGMNRDTHDAPLSDSMEGSATHSIAEAAQVLPVLSFDIPLQVRLKQAVQGLLEFHYAESSGREDG